MSRRQSLSINISNNTRNKSTTNNKNFITNNNKSNFSKSNRLRSKASALHTITRSNNSCNRILCSKKVWSSMIICNSKI